MRRTIGICLGLLLLLAACKKDPHNEDDDVKIIVFSGNNQSDTIGTDLEDSLVIIVDGTDRAKAHTLVKIVQKGCNYQTKEILKPDAHGFASYAWKLTSTVGPQVLKIYAVDTLLRVLDSTTATATGLHFDNAWLPADCFSRGQAPDNMVQLPDGRILAPARELYVSANEGRSWAPLATFPSGEMAFKVTAQGDRVFVLTGSGILYSPDRGATWQKLNTPLNLSGFPPVELTKSGKLFVSTILGVFRSADYGATWENVTNRSGGLGFYSTYFHDFCEAPNGTLYAVNSRDGVWESFDGGITWRGISGEATALWVDEQGDIYIGRSGLNRGEILKRERNGTEWVLLASFPAVSATYPEITHLRKVNGSFYFEMSGYGLMKTSDFSTSRLLRPSPLQTYWVTGSGAAVVAGNGREAVEVWYNLKP